MSHLRVGVHLIGNLYLVCVKLFNLSKCISQREFQQQNSMPKSHTLKYIHALFLFNFHLQRRVGGPLRRDRRVRAWGRRRDYDKASVCRREMVRRLLPETTTRQQPEESVVPRVLAASLSLQTERTSTGEPQIQQNLRQWVTNHNLRDFWVYCVCVFYSIVNEFWPRTAHLSRSVSNHRFNVMF